MTSIKALSILENMPEDEFQVWFKELPYRVQLMVRGGLANWREVLPEWYKRGHIIAESEKSYDL